MTKELKEKVTEIARLAHEICGRFSLCNECPLCMRTDEKNECTVKDMWYVLRNPRKDELVRIEEPTYEDLPIDLDDDYHCDECYKPVFNECLTDKYNDDCPYDLGECCEDNLATNVGRICFEHNVSTNVAMALIEIIQKERDRNEYLHLYRKHFPAE